MSFSVTEVLREIPPFQDAIAQTGDVSLRCVSQDFKTTFDRGICRVWTNLKNQAKDMKILSVFMSNAEGLYGEPTQENFFSRFKQLKILLKDNVKYIFPNPADRLPTDIDCFQFCGSKYVRNNVPEEIRKKASKIHQLKRVIEYFRKPPDIPRKLKCLVTLDIMTIPIFDSSHCNMQGIWNKAKEGELTVYNGPGDWDFFHIMDITTIDSIIDKTGNCPDCHHPIHQEDLRINAVLQNEILHFLKNQVGLDYREVFIQCDVGEGNTLGYRSHAEWGRTVLFTWTAEGWTGFLPVGSQFKLLQIKDSNVVWENRKKHRFIPQGMKEGPLHLDDIFF